MYLPYETSRAFIRVTEYVLSLLQESRNFYNTVFDRDKVCLRNICVNSMHERDNVGDIIIIIIIIIIIELRSA
jgi:hypothetical protein